MQPKEIDKQLLITFLEGNCSKEQLQQVKQYMTDEAYRSDIDAFLQEEWKQAVQTHAGTEEPGIDQAYDKLLEQLGRTEKAPVVRIYKNRIARIASAAAVIVVITTGIAYWWQHNNGAADRGAGVIALQQKTWRTQPGKINHIVLLDSSEVYLAGASTLTCNTGYGINNRHLMLEGEAYFIARHGKQFPFTVTTDKLSTVDVGTEFNIRYYKNMPTIEVAVAKGEVKVCKPNPAGQAATLASLVQQQQLSYHTGTMQWRMDLIPDTEKPGSWRDGMLFFRKQPLVQVAAALERYYGVTIRIEKPGDKEILITTAIEKMSVKEAIEVLALTAGVTYTLQGNTVILQ